MVALILQECAQCYDEAVNETVGNGYTEYLWHAILNEGYNLEVPSPWDGPDSPHTLLFIFEHRKLIQWYTNHHMKPSDNDTIDLVYKSEYPAKVKVVPSSPTVSIMVYSYGRAFTLLNNLLTFQLDRRNGQVRMPRWCLDKHITLYEEGIDVDETTQLIEDRRDKPSVHAAEGSVYRGHPWNH